MITKACVGSVKLEMIRDGWKRSEIVRRSSSIGHKCRNMYPEPGVAHHYACLGKIWVQNREAEDRFI